MLYARSMSENIAYGVPATDWSQTDIEDAARQANAHTFITEMKDGYQTQAGEKGKQLSGKPRETTLM